MDVTVEYEFVSNATTGENSTFEGELNVWALLGVIFFYLMVLAVGIYASWKSKSWKNENSEDVMVAGRNIGLVVGIFTMSATWVGGGYINGLAEMVYSPGYHLAWCQAPLAYFISGIIAGLFFAKPMRAAGYVTMLDPFQAKYGRVMTSLLYLPALTGDIFWTAAILSALGASLAVIIGLAHRWAVIISACVSVLYTLVGGLYSVAYTDVIQLICIFIGLWLAVPFALTNSAVASLTETSIEWVGSFPTDRQLGLYIDSFLLLIFGGIPWQVFFQRILSQKTPERARLVSFFASVGCLTMAIPSILFGAIGASTNWNETAYTKPIEKEDYKLIVPLVLQYLTPTVVSVIGLGAVSAAVMSSADSTILSSSSMFARNVYKPLRDAITEAMKRDRMVTERELLWVMRVAIVVIGAVATLLAINVTSIYGLWFLCSDLVYVILFPQLVCVVFVSFTNTYGSGMGYIVGLFFRLSGGEPYLGFPPLITYPYYDEIKRVQCFPFKTMSMILSLVAILVVSHVTRVMFKKGWLPSWLDIAEVMNECEDDHKRYEAGVKIRESGNDDDCNEGVVFMNTVRPTELDIL